MTGMTDSNNEAVIIFANCAGAARGENCNPRELGKYLGKMTAGMCGSVRAVGLSEVILSAGDEKKYVPLSGPFGSGSERDISLKGERMLLSDLEDFEEGFTGKSKKRFDKFYLSHLDSRHHCHHEAIERKWRGEKASKRIREQITSARTVYQGTAALIDGEESPLARGVQIRPAGLFPLSSPGDNPFDYRGSRDTEPRAAIIFCGLKITGNLTVNLAFCQLETNSGDLRVAAKHELEQSRGTAHRIKQIDNLCSALFDAALCGSEYAEYPVILMGDFNARPGTKELEHLCSEYGFSHVLPGENLDAAGLDYKKRENHQEPPWPYSFLRYNILIDHAFVKDFPEGVGCKLHILPLRDENDKKERVSDHRPIILTITDRG